MNTLKQALDHHILYHHVAPETADWYRRAANVYCRWAGCDPPIADFNGESISRFLADKLAAGRSPYYVKSLRGGMRAILGVIRGDSPIEKIRKVKCPPLEPEAWTAAEVERLLSPGCDALPEGSRFKYRLLIELGYYTGLDRCDLERLEQGNFASNGALIYRRSKTGKPVGGGIPLDLLAIIRERCPHKGPICRMGVTKEWVRLVFAGIVQRAGLFGTFKRLRKTSGSLVEKLKPGSGHKHLGNTQAIFERHYDVWRLSQSEPTMPPPIKRPPAA